MPRTLNAITYPPTPLIGVRVPLNGDISSLRALGPGGGQISRVVHVSTRAAFGVLREIRVLGVICKSRHEPIGVRGFLMFVGRFLKILGRRERTEEEKRM